MNDESNQEKQPLRFHTPEDAKRTSIHPSMKSKKGIRSWIKGDLIRLEDRDEGWEYRWCNKHDVVKMAQREAQGFVRVTRTSGLHVKNAGQADLNHSQTSPDTYIDEDGNEHKWPSTSGIVEMGDLVLMALRKDLAEERRQAVLELNREAVEGASTEDVESKLNRIGTASHGDGVKIEVK